MIKYLLFILLGIGGGVVISGAVFAFIAIIGVVPRLAQKTHTEKYIKIYEEAIIFGGILGALTMALDLYIPIGVIGTVIYSFAIGIFYGVVAVSLAEVLNVLPIIHRRFHLNKGLQYFILSLALGKALGSIMYYGVFGFYRK